MTISTTKKMCPVHRFNYSGNKCPFCEQDRINSMVQKYNKPIVSKKESIIDNNIISEDDIMKLKEKFNCR